MEFFQISAHVKIALWKSTWRHKNQFNKPNYIQGEVAELTQ